jgi:hypothetical protein
MPSTTFDSNTLLATKVVLGVGTPVSSLYGALTLCVFVCEVPSVFAYPKIKT